MDSGERHRFESAVMRILAQVNESPPRLVSAVGKFLMEFEPLVLELNMYFEIATVVAIRMFNLVERTINTLLEISIRGFDDFSLYHNMHSESPWSTLMGVFTVMAELLVIIEDRWPLYRSHSTKPWQCVDSAHSFEYILSNNMCSSSRPIKSYTMHDMVVALKLLSTHWYRLEPNDQLHTYLYALLHRGCILVAHPGPDTVHNIDSLRSPSVCASGGANGTYEANSHAIRLISMQLVRMILLVEMTRKRFVCVDAPAMGEDVAGIRRFMRKHADTLARTREAKAELTVLFSRLMISHGDSERFVQIRGIESARPMSVIMTVKPETQQSYMHLHQFLLLDRIIAVTADEEPGYFDRWTRAEHAYTVLLKIYLMNTALMQYGINFFNNFFVLELDLPVFANKIMHNRREPLLIQLFGKVHVFHKNQIHRCTSIEHALAMWMRLVVRDHAGTIQRRNITRSINDVLAGGVKHEGHGAARGVEDLALAGNIIVD